jgi:uncharacterized repeat protein (TIGR03847 family)
MNQSFDLPNVERLATGAVGEPGQRTFYLQAREGPKVVTLKLEKQQVGALCTYLENLLADLPTPEDPDASAALEAPIEPDWTVGSLGVTYDEDSDRVLIVAEEMVAEEEEGAIARFGATRSQVAAFAKHGASLVEAGRPPCPLCGNPLDPRGHVCPRLNGHGPPTP